MKMRVYILLGGFFGKDGWVVSAPFLGLRSQIQAAVPAAEILTYTWDQWDAAGLNIAIHQDEIIAAVGYSGGGWCLAELARRYRSRRIDLAVFYDPSPKWKNLSIVGTGIKRALCYHNNLPLMLGLGGGQILGPQVETVEINEQHIFVQSDQALHARTVKEIQRLATQ